MKYEPSLLLTVVALALTCGCSSYEVASSGDPAPLPDPTGVSLDVEVSYGPGNAEPATQFFFAIPDASWVRLEILNVTAHRVRLLVDEELEAGGHSIFWDFRNDNGEEVKTGIYFYALVAGEYAATVASVFCRTVEECEDLRDEN